MIFSPMMRDLGAAKRAVRQTVFVRRQGWNAANRGSVLAGHLLWDCPPSADAIVSGFWPLGDEIDLRPLLRALQRQWQSGRLAGRAATWRKADIPGLATG
jgi:hypothetical protein